MCAESITVSVTVEYCIYTKSILITEVLTYSLESRGKWREICTEIQTGRFQYSLSPSWLLSLLSLLISETKKMSNLLSESSPIRLSVLQEQIYVNFSRSLIDGQMMISSRYRAFQLDSHGFDSTPCKFTCLWVHNDIWGCDLRRFTVKTIILVHQISHQQTSDLKTMLKTCAHTCPSPVIINYINGVIF